MTSSLAGFEWLSGYHPSPREAKLLLEKTATPTVHSHEKPRKNGVGLLNSYKLGEVAKRLKKKCGKSSFCFKREIRKDENYHFEFDKSLKEDILRGFPECSLERGDKEDKKSHCGEKGRIFKRLRQAILLNPSRKELWDVLACIYSSGGFTDNAEALKTMALSQGSRREVNLSLIKSLDSIVNTKKNWTIIDRYILKLIGTIGRTGGKETFQALIELSENKGSAFKKAVIISAGEVGEVQFLDRLSTDKDKTVRRYVADAIGKMGGTEGLQLLDRLSTDKDETVRRHVADAIGKMGGTEEGLQLLDRLSTDKDKYVRSRVAHAIGEMGGTEGFQLLDRLSTDKDRAVRFEVTYAAGKMGGTEGLQLLDRLSTDKDEHVRSKVADAIGEMGGTEGFQLLDRLSTDKNEHVRSKVADAIGKMGGTEEGFQLLDRLSTDKDEHVRSKVADAIGKMGGTKGFQLLDRLSTDKNTTVRKYVVSAAVEMGGTEGFQLLDRLSTDKDKTVRFEVAHVAGKIRGAEGARILKKLTKDTNAYIREIAKKELSKL